MTLGPAVLALLGPSLAPVLQAARWLTTAIAHEYRTALREAYDEAVAADPQRPVPVAELAFLTNGVMFTQRLKAVGSAPSSGGAGRRCWICPKWT